MKYKVGDRVRIKSIDWYNENKNKKGFIYFDYANFTPVMSQYCGEILTIKRVMEEFERYHVSECAFSWTDEMIEGLVEEEIIDIDDFQDDNEIIDVIDEYVHRLKNNECQINLPEGYQFTDENGNVINAMKIVLERKKPKYPTTYEECCKVLGVSEFEYNHTGTKVWYRHKLMATLDKLMLCRDAYWKLYGDEMGLGKPWEPDWKDDTTHKFIIHTIKDKIHCGVSLVKNHLLAFPTEEMRDAFCENFKELIEQCKELL